MKLTFHDGSKRWCKVIGKQLSKDGKRLVQAQHYFSANEFESAAQAAALVVEWKTMKRQWAERHASYLKTLGKPFADTPHWPSTTKLEEPPSPEAQANIAAARAEDERRDVDEIAYEHKDAPLEEIRDQFLEYRKKGVGVDFKASTNRTLEDNLKLAFHHLRRGIVAAQLMPEDVEEMRRSLLKAGISRRSVHTPTMP